MDADKYHCTWYVARTLLGCAPGHDTNKRILYRGDQVMWRWNENMDVWPEWKDKALQRVCVELNRLERAGGTD